MPTSATKSITEVAEILDLSISALEQTIARKHFLPQSPGQRGRRREWTLADAVRLALFVRLLNVFGLSAPVAGVLTAGPVHTYNEGAFFVAYPTHSEVERDDASGWMWAIVRKDKISAFLTGGAKFPKVLEEGREAEVIARNSKPNLGAVSGAIIIDLDRIEADLVAAWTAKAV